MGTHSDSDVSVDKSMRLCQARLFDIATMIRFACHELASPIGTINTAVSFMHEAHKMLAKKVEQEQLTAKELAQHLAQMDSVLSMCVKNSQYSSQCLTAFRMVSVPLCADNIKKIELFKFVDQVVLICKSRLKAFPHSIVNRIPLTLVVSTRIGELANLLNYLIEYLFSFCFTQEASYELSIDAMIDGDRWCLILEHNGERNLDTEMALCGQDTHLPDGAFRLTVQDLIELLDSQLQGRLQLTEINEPNYKLELILPLLD